MGVKIPRIISHKNMGPLLKALSEEPCYQPGSQTAPQPEDWHQRPVWLEVPVGELVRDELTTLALVGRNPYEIVPLTGKEGFRAQGLEGKVRIRKTLFAALMALRDIVPQYRGRIVVS